MLKRTLFVCVIGLALLMVGAYPSSAARLLSPLPSQPGDGPPLVEYQVALRPGGRWTSEMRVAPDGASLASSTPAVLGVQGDDPRRIVQAVLDAACADERLAGPVALNLSGSVRAGEVFSLTLPGNPSTGYSWEVLDGMAVSQVGEVESRQASAGLGAPARQAVWLEATATGQAAVRLLYRRPWEDVPPAQAITIQPEGLDLSGACAALSLPLPPPASMPVVAAAGVAPPSDSTAALLPAFNWCDQGGCTPVKNQKACGSCWAFATVGVLESAIQLQQGLTVDLSEQYLVSCNTESPKWGCSGGWWAHDYHIQPGAVPESEFPYVASDVPCSGPYSHPYRISSWSHVGGYYSVPSVSAIKQAIYDHGPVAAAICVDDAFHGYGSGVFETDETAACGSDEVNHAIILVGWDDSKQAWRLRNSWGTGWGESGYMWIRYGTSNVGYAANYIVYTYSPPLVPSHWVYLPLALRNYGTGYALRNGDFESGRDGSWSEYSSNGWALIMPAADLPIPPHGGNWAAWLGGDDDETAILSQRVTIPSNATTLNYWYGIGSQDYCGYDYASVQFGSVTVQAYNLCSSTNTGGWVSRQIDVTGWRGQTVDLRFVVTTDGSLNSNFFLDDVSLSTATGLLAPPALPAQPWGTEVSTAARGSH
jgi:C1A family cysteine protease/predicted secreted protein